MRIQLTPTEMTPEQRLQAVAALFSVGVLRLRTAPQIPTNSALANGPKLDGSSLELRREMSLTVPTG